jgi:uncharacterized protein YkwD
LAAAGGVLASVLVLGPPGSAAREDEAAKGREATGTPDDKEARAAFDYLNRVRQDPPAFSKEIGVDLSKAAKRPTLAWDKSLARAARDKALDMAKRNYFGHVNPDGLGMNVLIDRAGYKLPADWVEDKKANFFESIGAGYPGGKATIQQLIVDKGVADVSHRKHLLGMTAFWEGCKDGGIGFARAKGARYSTYVCILIARRR